MTDLVAELLEHTAAELDAMLTAAEDRFFPDARGKQHPPTDPWSTWLVLAGRGWGKTRVGAEWIADQALTFPATRWAVLAPTFADARDTCIEGESGVLAVLDRRRRQPIAWNRSLGELILPNASRLKLFSADEPERLRGPQHHGAWCDEPASWRYGPAAWDQLQFGLRLGDQPRTVVTGTPKPVALIRDLIARDTVAVTRGSTFENRDNLAGAALAELEARYAGTRLGRQELDAELLEDTPGALWTRHTLDEHRRGEFPDLAELVIGIDPAVTSADTSDETGMVAVGRGGDGHCYVLEDLSMRGTPHQVMSAAVDAFHDLQADRLVVERNNGGDYLPAMVRSLDPTVPVKTVVATRGKQVRAQPVSDLYERGLVHHVGALPVLEDQLCEWTPDTPGSPDRMDALVWAVTEMMLRSPGRRGLVAA